MKRRDFLRRLALFACAIGGASELSRDGRLRRLAMERLSLDGAPTGAPLRFESSVKGRVGLVSAGPAKPHATAMAGRIQLVAPPTTSTGYAT